MEKNTKWAIALSSIVLVGFFVAQTYFLPKPAQNQNVQNTAQKSEISEKATSENLEQTLSENTAEVEKVELNENIFIETDKVKARFTNKGGDLIGYELKEFKDTKDSEKLVEMINNVSEKNRALSVSLGSFDSEIINSNFEIKTFDNDKYKIGFSKYFPKEDFTLYKTYSFKESDYLFKLDIVIKGGANFKGLNTNGAAYTLRTAPQIGPKYNPKDRYDVRDFIAYDPSDKDTFTPKVDSDEKWTWSGVVGKYFEFLINTKTEDSTVDVLQGFKLVKTEGDSESNSTQLSFARKSVENLKGESTLKDSYFVYIGPRSESELEKYNSAKENFWGISGTRYNESLPTSGILNWLETILKFLMEMINKVVHNWGVSIIILTILLRFALYPLTKKSLVGSKKMQDLQPKLKALQEKYKNNPQALQQEQMKIYKEAGYNPLAGCLPMIIQFVVLWAMYHLFNNYFEFRGASFIDGWISDLSTTDTVYTFSFNLPFLGDELHVLPIIYLASQLLYGKITQNGGTATAQGGMQMKIMMYVLPIVFFFLFYSAPSGLLLYWTVSNLFQLVQQLFINKVLKNTSSEPKNPKAATVYRNKNKK